MSSFVRKHADKVTGVISGFDRLVFRGFLGRLCRVEEMMCHLSLVSVLLKDFAAYSKKVTDQVVAAAGRQARTESREVIYVESSRTKKEDIARQVMADDKISDGLITVLKCIEPCLTYRVKRCRETKSQFLEKRVGKCSFLYFYIADPVFGFMHARLQTWFPFNIQVCINGRDWLSRQLDDEGIAYRRLDNCFPWIEDFGRAQELLDEQPLLDWQRALDEIATYINPALEEVLSPFVDSYYWTAYQSEWATDLAFRDAEVLAELYERITRFGISTLKSPDVLRFLGKKIPAHGHVAGNFTGEVCSTLKHRPEGIRLKHESNGNSVKIYDKQGTVLRVETTLSNPKEFKVFRPKQGCERGYAWRNMRKGVADLHRRAEVSQGINDRYLERLGSLEDTTPLGKLAGEVCQPAKLNGKRVRPLRPWSQTDAELLEAVGRGEFVLTGFRNRDLRTLLYPSTDIPKERRRQSAAVTRRIRLLRAHGLVRKIQKSHRYQLTDRGRLLVTALITARDLDAKSLYDKAA